MLFSCKRHGPWTEIDADRINLPLSALSLHHCEYARCRYRARIKNNADVIKRVVPMFPCSSPAFGKYITRDESWCILLVRFCSSIALLPLFLPPASKFPFARTRFIPTRRISFFPICIDSSPLPPYSFSSNLFLFREGGKKKKKERERKRGRERESC